MNCITKNYPLLLLFCLALCPLWLSMSAHAQLQLQLEFAQKIWDRGNHNAFTDLTHFQGRFYCVFREAAGHVSPAGKIRVLSSKDGRDWDAAALIALEGYDLRDPKITVFPKFNQLMINGGAAVRQEAKPATDHRSFVCRSKNGKNWTKPQWVAETHQWLWRITWHKEKAYGVAYDVAPKSRADRNYGTTLWQSDDGLKFTKLVNDLFAKHGPTEATLRFDNDDTAYCLQRRDGRPKNTAILGISQPPYTKWEWHDLGMYFGGPNFIQLPRGRWIAAGRIHTERGAKTKLCLLDVENPKLQPILTLPSGGDTSYPGLLWHENTLWISYYSSHEGKTAIYLAQVSIKK
ncbi:exo-alpha-sialidase [bacterium]|nr:exo-alpha-sialidase [bacterium]